MMGLLWGLADRLVPGPQDMAAFLLLLYSVRYSCWHYGRKSLGFAALSWATVGARADPHPRHFTAATEMASHRLRLQLRAPIGDHHLTLHLRKL